MRAIPNLTVIRPADATETAAAWRLCMQMVDSPVAMILSRQNLPIIDRTQYAAAEGLLKGAYILSDSPGKPDIILMASGSEVHLALAAKEILAQKSVFARVVSMPSWGLFEKNSQEYKDNVLLPDVTARIAVETGIAFGWERYVGNKGDIIAMRGFGASAPGATVMEKFGFTADNVVKRAMSLL